MTTPTLPAALTTLPNLKPWPSQFNTYVLFQHGEILNTITRNSTNTKTGDMMQLNHFVWNMPPLLAHQLGLDITCCGHCELRIIEHDDGTLTDGPCYVVLMFANATYYAALRHGELPFLWPTDKGVRAGAYGCPTIGLDYDKVEPWFEAIRAHGHPVLGYTHEWPHCDQRWQRYLMASIDAKTAALYGLSRAEFQAWATVQGWRTYSVIDHPDELQPGEIMCPYPRVQLGVDCGLCAGTYIQAKHIATYPTQHKKEAA